MRSCVVTYQLHNKVCPGHSLSINSNKTGTPRATRGKRLNHENTLHLKKHTNECQHTQAINEADAQDSPDWLSLASDVIP